MKLSVKDLKILIRFVSVLLIVTALLNSYLKIMALYIHFGDDSRKWTDPFHESYIYRLIAALILPVTILLLTFVNDKYNEKLKFPTIFLLIIGLGIFPGNFIFISQINPISGHSIEILYVATRIIQVAIMLNAMGLGMLFLINSTTYYQNRDYLTMINILCFFSIYSIYMNAPVLATQYFFYCGSALLLAILFLGLEIYYQINRRKAGYILLKK